ncbi:MAG: 23S rRNA (pseudouridine(1915)-N(3))-methyltransferase RlmH, partial [Betaproteobacteria bacterium]
MIRIRIIAVGSIKERYLVEGIREFVKRLTPLCKLEIVEVAEERMPEDPSAAEKTKTIAAEGERLLKQIPK